MWLCKLSHKNDAASGTSFVVWWLRFHISMQGGSGLIPGQGTRSLMLQLKILHAARKIPHTARKILHAATKTQCSQIKKKKKIQLLPGALRTLALEPRFYAVWEVKPDVEAQVKRTGKPQLKASINFQMHEWASFYMAPLPRPGLPAEVPDTVTMLPTMPCLNSWPIPTPPNYKR